jgi:hypothetical protein
MFSPAGYHPAAALWIEFLEHRLESSYVTTALHYRKTTFLAGVVRGSPLDICEHYFLKTLANVGFHLASPSGEVVKVHVLLRDEHAHLLSVADPYDSAWYAAQMMVEEEENKSSDAQILPSWFTSWPHEMEENNAWADTYELDRKFTLSLARSPYNDLRHHTFPLHFERHSYLISSTVPDFALASSLSQDVGPILVHFAGWSICLDDATYKGEWSEYLHGKKKLFPDKDGDDNAASIGRPRLQRAHAAFEAMSFDKGELSWAQLIAKIDKMTGERPSAKALRNWRDLHLKR